MIQSIYKLGVHKHNEPKLRYHKIIKTNEYRVDNWINCYDLEIIDKI